MSLVQTHAGHTTTSSSKTTVISDDLRRHFGRVMNSIWEQVSGRSLASSTSRNFFSRWKNRKAKELGSERSVRDYRDITDAFIEFLAILARADEEISRITPSDIIKFRDSLLERVAPVTANKYVKVLRGAFQDALRERLISENPARVELVGSIKKERGSGDGPASV